LLYFVENLGNWSEAEVFKAALEYYRVVYGRENAVEESNDLIDAISEYYLKEDETRDYVWKYQSN